MNPEDIDTSQREVGSNGADALGEHVSGMAREAATAAKDHADELLSDATRGAADAATKSSDAMDSLAGSLADSGQDTLGRAVGAVSHRLQQFAAYLDGRDLDSLARDARALAQRHPGLLVAGGLALGFAMSRLFKASAQNGATRSNARTHYKARTH